MFLGEGCRATLSNVNCCDTMVAVLQGAHVKMKHCSYAMLSSLQTDAARFMLGSNFSSSAALACLVVDGQGSTVQVESTTKIRLNLPQIATFGSRGPSLKQHVTHTSAII